MQERMVSVKPIFVMTILFLALSPSLCLWLPDSEMYNCSLIYDKRHLNNFKVFNQPLYNLELLPTYFCHKRNKWIVIEPGRRRLWYVPNKYRKVSGFSISMPMLFNLLILIVVDPFKEDFSSLAFLFLVLERFLE
jgi:hypothetical protein